MHRLKKSCIALAIGQAISSGSHATVYTLSNGSNCKLPDAIAAANSNTITGLCAAGSSNERDVINMTSAFNSIAPTTLNMLPFVTSDITINGVAVDARISRVGNQAARFVAVTGQGDLIVNNLAIRYSSFPVGTDFDGAGFYVGENASLELNNVTIFSSNNDSGGNGGAIFTKGILSIDGCDISQSRADNGGGIHIEGGTATIKNCEIDNNSSLVAGAASLPSKARGAGIFIENSDVTIQQSTISNNVATRAGGGLFSSDSSLLIVDSTISSNRAEYFHGGGLNIRGASSTISNTTVSGNNANYGAGIYFNLGADASLINVTSARNSSRFVNRAGGLALFGGSQVRVSNSVIADSITGSDCRQSGIGTRLIISGNSIIEDASCASAAQAVDPQLGSLNANGGTTWTHLPSASSPVINAGSDPCPASDQRSQPRLLSGPMMPIKTQNNRIAVIDLSSNCDIGAVQRQPSDDL